MMWWKKYGKLACDMYTCRCSSASSNAHD